MSWKNNTRSKRPQVQLPKQKLTANSLMSLDVYQYIVDSDSTTYASTPWMNSVSADPLIDGGMQVIEITLHEV